MDLDFRTGIYAANALVTAAIAIWLWLQRRHDRNGERIGALESKVTANDSKLALMEQRLVLMETSQVEQNKLLVEIGKDLREVKGKQEAQSVHLQAIQDSLHLIQEHLLNNNNGRAPQK